MSLAIISDIHIKTPGDDGDKLFQKFLLSSEVQKSQAVFLLGDIFDLMVGNHKEYLESYSVVFGLLEKLISKNIEIYFVEGNHDFHLENLFKMFIRNKKLNSGLVHYYRKGFVFDYEDKKIYFSHGDDIELGNPSYKLYKYFIASRPLKFIANNLMPYHFLSIIGEKASKKSRARNVRKYATPENQSFIKTSFRQAAEVQWNKLNTDYIICGHSHAKENYLSEKGFRYLNCGFVKKEENFILIDKKEARFINL